MTSDRPASGLALHDIVLPEPVSWVPRTPGWWILLGLLIVVLAWATWAVLRRRRDNRYRRLALERLGRIETALEDPATRSEAIADVPVLVKETALAFRPRAEVAALSGEAWLRFLDESYGGNAFTEGAGRLLPTLAYGTPATTGALSAEDLKALTELVRRWIRRHRVRV